MYPGANDFYFGNRGVGLQRGIFRDDGYPDTRIISLDAIKENFSSVLDEENNVKEEFIDYINQLK